MAQTVRQLETELADAKKALVASQAKCAELQDELRAAYKAEGLLLRRLAGLPEIVDPTASQGPLVASPESEVTK